MTSQFESVTEAYDILSDDKSRSIYDKTLGIFRSHHEYESIYKNKNPSSASKNANSSNSKSSKASNNNRLHSHIGMKTNSMNHPVFGFNREEWLAYHYGFGNVNSQSGVRQSMSNMPNNKYYDYTKKKANRDYENLQRILEKEGFDEDAKINASKILNMKLQDRASRQNADETSSICVIS